MRILRAAGHRVMPWKNGGGSTTEVAVFPEAAGLEAFDWRVSMAGVVEDGAFSRFPGIDRTLALVEGGGLVLETEHGAPVTLAREGEAARFAGDAATSARLLAGPILDLNVMTRRGRFTHELAYHPAGARAEIAPAADVTVLLARGAMGAGAGTLEMNDAVLLAPGDAPLATNGEAAFFVVRFRAMQPVLDN